MLGEHLLLALANPKCYRCGNAHARPSSADRVRAVLARRVRVLLGALTPTQYSRRPAGHRGVTARGGAKDNNVTLPPP